MDFAQNVNVMQMFAKLISIVKTSISIVIHLCGCVYAFVNTWKQGCVRVNNKGNEDTLPNEDILVFLLCPGDHI